MRQVSPLAKEKLSESATISSSPSKTYIAWSARMCLCKGLPIPGGEMDSTRENWFPVSTPGICIFHRSPVKSNVSAFSSALMIFLDINLLLPPHNDLRQFSPHSS